MPKIKTNRGAAKRFRVTKTKKFKYAKSGRRHILEDKSPRSGRQKRGKGYVHDANKRQIKQLLPYA